MAERTPAEVIRDLAARHPNLKTHFRYNEAMDEDLSNAGPDSEGLIDAELLESLLPGRDADYDFCGPKPFMMGIYHNLLDWGSRRGRCISNSLARGDWDKHLLRFYGFRETVLFGGGSFRWNPLGIHFKLVAMTSMDWPKFQRWLALFDETVDELFAGDRAAHIKRVADGMAHVVHSRINGVPDRRFGPSNPSAQQPASRGQKLQG